MKQSLTLQDVFNNAWNAYVIRGEGPGYDEKTERCKYFAPNGCRCAIGHSIPDDLEEIVSTKQVLSIDSLIKEEPEVKALFLKVYSHDLRGLQDLHDCWAKAPDQVNIKDLLTNLAVFKGLTVPMEAI